MYEQQNQYMEDKLSVLDIGKTVFSAYVNPFTQASFDPNFWSPSTYGGIRVRSGILDPNNKVNKFGRWAVNGISKLATGHSLEDRFRAKRWKNTIRPKGSTTFKTSYGPSGTYMGLNSLEANISRMSGGFLHYTDGYLGVRMGKLFDFSGARESKFVQRMNTIIKGRSNLNDIPNMINNVGSEPIMKYKRKNIGPAKNNPLVPELRSKYKQIYNTLRESGFESLIDENITDSKGLLKHLTSKSTKAHVKIKVAAARIGKSAYYAGRFAGKVAVKGALLAGKAYSVYGIASLMYQGIKLVANPLAQMGVNAVDQMYDKVSSLARPEMGGQLSYDYLSQGAATERQRAIQAISKSRINGRSMMGNEAQYMHA